MEKIPHKRLVFDLADDLSVYNADDGRRGYIAGCIDNIAKGADLMVVISPTLHDKYITKRKSAFWYQTALMKNYLTANRNLSRPTLRRFPDLLSDLWGVLFGFLDYDMIYEVAAAMPEASFVFVGPVEKDGWAGVERLKTLSHTCFLG